MRAMWIAVTNVMLILCFLVVDALAHDQRFTDEENDWLNRQYAHDGTKCCDRTDIHLLQDGEWKMQGGSYHVKIMGEWHEVPAGRMRVVNPDDPSPFGDGHALLFYSVHGTTVWIWCFTPATLG